LEEKIIFRKNLGKRLGEILIELEVIDENQLNEALALHQNNGKNHISSGEALIKLGFASEKDILRAVTIQYSFPYLPIDNYEIDEKTISLIPAEVARKYLLVPIEKMNQILNIAISNPLNTQALEDVKAICKRELRTFIATPSEILRAIDKYYDNGTNNNGSNGYETQNNSSFKKRKFKRRKTNIHSVMILNNSQMIGIKLENISSRGLCGQVTHPLQIDEQPEIVLHHPFFKEPVNIKTRVIWCNKEISEDSWRVGLGFDLDKDDKIDLDSYMKSRNN